MYKVLIIDDEPIIRKGLKNIIAWNQFGCEVCGEAADGIEGVEMIESLSPDIIFTDICMPEMDGLEMIKQMVDTEASAKIVILTGFCDFDYVKEALVLGAFDYILKPTKLDEIQEVITRAVKALDEEKEKKDLNAKLKENYHKSLPKLREKLLFEVMMGITTDKNEINIRKERLDIELDEYIMVLAEKAGSRENIKYGAIQTFVDMLGEYYSTLSVAIDDCNVALIVSLKNADDEAEILSKCDELQVLMRDSFNMDLKLSISDKGRGMDDIFLSFGQCRSTVKNAIEQDNNMYELFKSSASSNKKNADVKFIGLGQLLLDTIPFGSLNLTIDSLNNLYNEALKLKETDDAVNDKLKSIVISISRAAGNDEYKPSTDATFDGLFAEIRHFAETATNAAKDNSLENMKLVTKKAIEYLQKNYQHQVTLNEVADAVYVSPFYISRMFKKETGKTMTEFLNDLRIDNACVLLEDLQYKVYQVGEMVGISDAHYFSRMFKNSVGITPSEYRNKLKA